jgi:hypothetical protein
MSLILDGSAGVSFPSGSGTQAAQSKVLQVVNATYSTAVSNSTNTPTDTGLTATITPLFSTSKILVLVSQNGVSKDTNNTYALLRLVRNGSSILAYENQLNYSASSVTASSSSSICYLDSPASTSALTYKTQLASGSNNASVSVQASASTSTITLMEIAV